MSIREVTRSPAALINPPGEKDRCYGTGTVFQVGPTTGALCCCLRVEGMPVGDFEDGSDIVLFSDVREISKMKPIEVSRNEKYIHPQTNQPRIVIKYPIVGGFVPFGAKRPDGSPHPHAGTGFGISEALDFPMLEGGYYTKAHKTTEMVRKTDVTQFVYDGREFRVTNCRRWTAAEPCRVPGSDWIILSPGLRQGIIDGDDLLAPMVATQGDPSAYNALPLACGVSRWRRIDGNWQPSGFVSVAHTQSFEDKTAVGSAWGEPSLIRDMNGSLLFTSRGCFGNLDHVIRVWRSSDGGQSWRVIANLDEARGQAPVTINQAADGTPYIVANVLGHERDWLSLWPLKPDRSGLESRVEVRNALEQFGPPPSGKVWFMDHPNGHTIRLADGNWHHLLTYRIMDRGEHGGGAPPPQTGQYVEEVISDGPVRAPWKFE